MSQLGFTFYPKDWWTSDSFYALQPFERYIYLECLFLMYVNDGWIADDKLNVERRLLTTIKDDVWVKVKSLFHSEDGNLTHKSINKRLNRSFVNKENGKKGGAPKGNQNAKKQPKQPNENNPKNNLNQPKKQLKTTDCFSVDFSEVDISNCKTDNYNKKNNRNNRQNNPPFKIEEEIEKEIEDEEEKTTSTTPTISPEIEKKLNRNLERPLPEIFQEMDKNTLWKEQMCMKHPIPGSTAETQMKNFDKFLSDFYTFLSVDKQIAEKSLSDTYSHFSNWLPKQINKNG